MQRGVHRGAERHLRVFGQRCDPRPLRQGKVLAGSENPPATSLPVPTPARSRFTALVRTGIELTSATDVNVDNPDPDIQETSISPPGDESRRQSGAILLAPGSQGGPSRSPRPAIDTHQMARRNGETTAIRIPWQTGDSCPGRRSDTARAIRFHENVASTRERTAGQGLGTRENG